MRLDSIEYEIIVVEEFAFRDRVSVVEFGVSNLYRNNISKFLLVKNFLLWVYMHIVARSGLMRSSAIPLSPK